MQHVWIVGSGEYSDSEPHAAFTSREEAHGYVLRIAQQLGSDRIRDWDRPWLLSVPLNPPDAVVEPGEHLSRIIWPDNEPPGGDDYYETMLPKSR